MFLLLMKNLKVLDEDRLYFPNKRIRDLKYDKKIISFYFYQNKTHQYWVQKD